MKEKSFLMLEIEKEIGVGEANKSHHVFVYCKMFSFLNKQKKGSVSAKKLSFSVL